MSLVLNLFPLESRVRGWRRRTVSHEDIPKLNGRVKPQQAPQADSPLSTTRLGGFLKKQAVILLLRGGWSWGKGSLLNGSS